MAGNGKRGGGGDRILESRHLVGLFLGVVLLCGVFFTLFAWLICESVARYGIAFSSSPMRLYAALTIAN